MNIGSLIRGLLGDSKAGDVKQLDVKTGQVVRGVVLSVSDDGQEAEIQIQGVKVHAKLETPLQQGQATMMQVQPPDDSGMMVLKPLSESPYTSLTAKSMGEVLSAVGLTDTKVNREMIQTLQASGVPLTKENATIFKAILMEKPAGVPPEQWLQSAAIAFQRGLPMTGESVRGLQQAVFGPPLHQLLSGLSEQLTLLAKQEGELLPSKGMVDSQVGAGTTQVSGATGTQDTVGKTGNLVGAQVQQGSQGTQALTGMVSNETVGKGAIPLGIASGTAASSGGPSPLQPLLAKLQGVLQQLHSTQLPNQPSQSAMAVVLPATASPSGSGNTTGVAVPVASLAGVVTPPASATAAAPGGTAAMVPPATQTAVPLGEAPAGASQQLAPSQGEEPWVGRMLKLLGAEHEQQAVRGGATPQAQQAPQGTAAAGNVPLGNTAAAVPVPQPQAASAVGNAAPLSSIDEPTNQPQGTKPTANAPLTTQEQAAQSTQGASFAHVVKGTSDTILQVATTLPIVGGNGNSTDMPAHDSLKGILLEMLDRTDLPPALREAAQQLVQQMTGQQLLLNTDRTAPFAQVTMFIPLNGQVGQETASVHIQARRGKKGELDASNCRLWFDLDMKHLGSTLVDVQVVDKIVSLKIHNDHEWMTSLIEDRRDEISLAIHSIGYQLLSLKAEPLPIPNVAEVDGKQGSVTSEYTPPTYKGVDMRI
ncbi:hypothetical protein [Paenibacillus antarcticus]|uniref:Uncharacterized protein n=1 Tax=Paenibacillus antarcticus TaxID=253703 RepID=A0A168MWN4_9BACL|nr:hypothetical protein [Paenibacillus antarcticus]OAB45135.1 hypothetical protein PBAT_14440 [Paenibacillus antarcticus]